MRTGTSILLALLAAAALIAGCDERRGPEGAGERPRTPHVVFVLADDLGWNDVGWHGSELATPALDALAARGVVLDALYASPVCTPTRASLMTGRYAHRLGLQSSVIRPHSDFGLPLDVPTLADELDAAGYATAIVGKWHLGCSAPEYLPTRRGFDTQYGSYNGAIDYWTKERLGGFDWHRDDRVARDAGYATDLVGAEAVRVVERHDTARPLFLYVPFQAPHAPLAAPDADVLAQPASLAPERRVYGAMVAVMDRWIGALWEALERRGMAQDTLFVFASDNGGDPAYGASNAPFSGGKRDLAEGGVRVPCFVVCAGRLAPRVETTPVAFVDWLPTALGCAGVDVARLDVDGVDLWPLLSLGRAPARAGFVVHVEAERGAVRSGPWKLVAEGALAAPDGDVTLALYDVVRDPAERTDRAGDEPERARALLAELRAEAARALPAQGLDDPPPEGFRAPAVWGERE